MAKQLIISILAMKEAKLDTSKFTLFKRGRRFYARKMYLARLYTVSLGTEDKGEALLVGPERLRERIERTEVLLGTVRQIVDHFDIHAIHLRPSTQLTVHNHLNCYLKAIGATLSSPTESVFTSDAARRFFAVRLKGKIHVDRNRASISANSVIRNTRSLFSSRMLETYPELPKCVQEWRRVKLLPARMPQYTVADKVDLMRSVIGRCNKMKQTDAEAYKAFWLALYCGLRRGEIAAARWDWLTSKGLLVQPGKSFTPKNGKSRLVPLSESQMGDLRKLRCENSEHIISGSYEARSRYIPNRIGKVMREEGFKGSKTLHELRKYYGANVATQLGLFAAQRYLGHETPSITSKYYADLVETKPIEVQILS
jgi:integrase